MHNPWRKQSRINPQVENGFRQIATDIYLMLVKYTKSLAELKICLCIINHTWGMRKLCDTIAISQITTETGISPRHIQRTISELKKRRIIHYEDSKLGNTQLPVNNFMFNKHYDTWAGVDKSDLETVKKWIKNKPVTPMTPVTCTSPSKESKIIS